MYDLIIIGAGPAGITAGIYGVRAGLNTLVINGGGVGGQILSTYEVDNYPTLKGISGMELGTKFKEHADALKVNIVDENVSSIEKAEGQVTLWKVTTTKGSYETKTVVIATGAQPRKLGAPGEEELTGMGVSYCATCDGAFYRGSDVAVVGGGDVALEDALFLARGSKKVHLIHRRDAFRAAKVLQDAVLAADNIEIHYDSVVENIKGVDEGEVNGLEIKNVKTGQVDTLDIEGIFIAVGTKPNTDLVQGIVECDQAGYVVAGEDCRSSEKGIYAAGDLRTKALRQVVTAVADGANAVKSIETDIVGL